MDSAITMLATLPRPKIHRLPALSRNRTPLLAAVHRPVFLPFAVLLVLSFAVMAIQKQIIDFSGSSHAVPFLPPVIVDARASVVPPEKSPATMVFTGQSGTIIGQFVRMPADNEQITEIRPVSDVDKTAGRELLSIISRIN
ncbi:MAG: hypothetical protein KGI29_04175 [Pseudomonadota bacterium]|nr:hypothetical protein [Pseudomonadota bacterium]MDE3037353.1 hypothetical protein [Pseudomonadota bacterium]